MLPAGCYDGDVMDRLALAACKQMESFRTGQNLANLVSTRLHPPWLRPWLVLDRPALLELGLHGVMRLILTCGLSQHASAAP